MILTFVWGNSQIADWQSLHLVYQLEARFDARLGAPHVIVPHQILLCRTQILVCTWQHSREDLDAYVRRFHRRALDWSDPVAEQVLVDVCFHRLLKHIAFSWRICLSHLFPGWWKWLVARTSQCAGPRDPVQQFNLVLIPWFSQRQEEPMVGTLERVKKSNHPARRSQLMARESLGNSYLATFFLWREEPLLF